jgi:RHS repeat-associated protein
VDANNNWVHTNVYAGGKQIGTYDSAGLHFYFDDPLGTRRAQANSSGQLEAAYQSLPFGDGLNQVPYVSGVTDPTENHFTGKERDTESGNDYMFARYYNSATGRFLSPDWSAKEDPVPYAKLTDPQSLNLYSYVENNPMDRFDPDGHQCDTCKKVWNWLTTSHNNANSTNTQTESAGPLTVKASAATGQYTPTIPSKTNPAVGAQVSGSVASTTINEGSHATTNVNALTANAGANAGLSLGGGKGLGANASASASGYVLSGTQTVQFSIAGVTITGSATGNVGIGISGSVSANSSKGVSVSNSETLGAGGGWSIGIDWSGLTASGGASGKVTSTTVTTTIDKPEVK